MRNTNKKGFTIVELVVVVAVIAILAAVLIPTFSGIIAKANQSADQQAVTNMNKLLAMNEKADGKDGAVDILIKEGYKGDLSTYFEGYQLAWVESENVIVLVEDGKIVYPKNYAGKELAYEIINPMATNIAGLIDSLKSGDVVFVGEDIEVTAENTLEFYEEGNYALNLNGHTINTATHHIKVATDSEEKVTISNGVIEADSSAQSAFSVWTPGATLVLEDVIVTGGGKATLLVQTGATMVVKNSKIYGGSGSNPIQCYGGNLELDNVTTVQSGDAKEDWYESAIQVASYYNSSNQITNVANVTIKSGEYVGSRAIQISSPGGNVTVNGGTFTGEYAVHGGVDKATYSNGESIITINGGTFNGAIYVSADTVLEINGGTFSIDPTTITTGTVTINGTVVDNGNGTWTVTK